MVQESEIFTVPARKGRAVRLTNDPRFLTAVLPSANVIGTPRDVGRFLQMLLQGGQLDGERVISPASSRARATISSPTGGGRSCTSRRTRRPASTTP